MAVYRWRITRRTGHDALDFPYPNCILRCKDGYIFVGSPEGRQWHKLLEIMGNPDWAVEARFGDGYQRWLNQDELDQRVEAWTLRLPPWEATRILQDEGVAAFPSLSADHLSRDLHLLARDVFSTVEHPEKGNVRAVAPPWRFTYTPAKVDRWTPDLGEHNVEVFHGLVGLEVDEVKALEQAQVVW